jgi:hypothetical protein
VKKLVLMWMLVLIAACQNGARPEESTAAVPTPTPNPKHYMVSAGEVGNGGHGRIKNGRVYLMDLLEVGVEERDAWYDTVHNPFANFVAVRERVKRSIPEELPVDEVAIQLTYLSHRDPVLATTLLEAISLYKWEIIDEEFKVLPLDGNIIESGEGDIVLIANRRGRTVHISRPMLKRMNILHRGALVIHEVVSALIPPKKVTLADGTETFKQDSLRGREITGLFYSKKLDGIKTDAGLGMFLSPGEIPYSDSVPLAVSRDNVVAGSFLTYGKGGQRANLGEGVLGLVGPVHLEYRSAGEPIAQVFDFERRYDQDRDIQKVCGQWYDRIQTLNHLAIDVVYAPTAHYKLYELSFQNYVEGKENKQYLAHREITGRRVIGYDSFFADSTIRNDLQLSRLSLQAYPGKEKYAKAIETNHQAFLKDCEERLPVSVLNTFGEILPFQAIAIALSKESFRNRAADELMVLSVYRGTIERRLKATDLDPDERRQLEKDLVEADEMIKRHVEKTNAGRKL